MSEFFEIAYAAASSKLCLFTGTGFSKAVSGNAAPSWQGLLESICDLTTEPTELKEALFPAKGKNSLSLEEAAQVISIELSKTGKNIHTEIAKITNALELNGDNSAISDFLSTQFLKIITTNYDKLVEKLAGEKDCHSITPGLPIPRSQARVKIYHVHGSVDSPENMVVTTDDYFKFINGESYFSRKLSTVLHENTIVILGYSLGDNNLKSIISDYKGFSRNHVIGSNIFLISRDKANQHIKDYYAHCYGIRVLDNMEIHDFFKSLNKSLPTAESIQKKSIGNIKKVIYEDREFARDFIKLQNSFFEIVSSLAAIGVSIDDAPVVKALGNVIKIKIELTKENAAWVQYEHLAEWLIYLGSILELKGTSIEKIFLNATLNSMQTMSKKPYLGFSWRAYDLWSNRWSRIIASNRVLIRSHIEKNSTDEDALLVVQST
jgi:SIR2-like domain